MRDLQKIIPRKIWILWFQGIAEAPFVVQKCIESWRKENRNWEVIVLDKRNLSDYIELALPDNKLASFPLTKQSNLVRLQLLTKFGGIWADATTLCMKPLDDWLDDCLDSGFFSFYNPGRDRIIANWFMVCKKECPIILKMRENYVSFFMENNFNVNGRFKQLIIKVLNKILNRSTKTTKCWLSPVVTKILKVYPYFIFHYMFEMLVSSDLECRMIWNNTKKINAADSFNILKAGLKSPLNDNVKKEIDEKCVPIYKLTWKYDHSQCSQSSALYYLLEGRQRVRILSVIPASCY